MRRWRRLVVQLAMIPLLWVLASLNEDLFRIVVSVSVLATWPVTVSVAILLIWLSNQSPEIDSLTESADNMATLALAHTSLVGVTSVILLRLLGFHSDLFSQYVLVGLGYALVLLVLPAISWLRTLRDVWLPRIRLKR